MSAIDTSAQISSTLNSIPPVPPPTTNQPACACTITTPTVSSAANHKHNGITANPAASATVPATSTSDKTHATMCAAGTCCDARKCPNPPTSCLYTRVAPWMHN